jgi:hypothetical protein
VADHHPWVVQNVDRTTHVLVSNIIVGAVIAVLGAAATGMDALRHRRRQSYRASIGRRPIPIGVFLTLATGFNSGQGLHPRTSASSSSRLFQCCGV